MTKPKNLHSVVTRHGKETEHENERDQSKMDVVAWIM